VSELFTAIEQQDFFHRSLIGSTAYTAGRPPKGKIENDGGRVPMSFARNKQRNDKTVLIYTHESQLDCCRKIRRTLLAGAP
jgi:hypothetical protein